MGFIPLFLLKCDNRCGREAIYQQNKYTALCITCWYETAHDLFIAWDKDKTKPTPWIFCRDRLILGRK